MHTHPFRLLACGFFVLTFRVDTFSAVTRCWSAYVILKFRLFLRVFSSRLPLIREFTSFQGTVRNTPCPGGAQVVAGRVIGAGLLEHPPSFT